MRARNALVAYIEPADGQGRAPATHINVSGTMARALRLQAGAAALKIVRRYLDAAGKAFRGVGHLPSGRTLFDIDAAAAVGQLGGQSPVLSGPPA